MDADYNLVIYPDGPTSGKHWVQILPFGNYKITEQVGDSKIHSWVFDTTGSVYRLYSVDDAYNEQPLSAIYFWCQFDGNFFGELLSTGVKVKAKAYPTLNNLAVDGANLDVTISNTLFRDAKDLEGLNDAFEPWSVAQRLKGLKTHPYSLYNNHNFYTISDKNEDK